MALYSSTDHTKALYAVSLRAGGQDLRLSELTYTYIDTYIVLDTYIHTYVHTYIQRQLLQIIGATRPKLQIYSFGFRLCGDSRENFGQLLDLPKILAGVCLIYKLFCSPVCQQNVKLLLFHSIWGKTNPLL